MSMPDHQTLAPPVCFSNFPRPVGLASESAARLGVEAGDGAYPHPLRVSAVWCREVPYQDLNDAEG